MKKTVSASIKLTFTLFLLVLITGCSTQISPAEQATFSSANRVVTEPVVVSPKPTKMAYQLSYNSNPALMRAYSTYLRTGKAPDVVTEGFIQFAYGTGSQPIVNVSPNELTVVSLETGEQVTNVSSGDPNHWTYSLAVSGSGSSKQQHVLVKPSLPDISTDFVITTDKRLYTLKMVSTDNAHYMRDVRFWYPDEIQSLANADNDAETKSLTQDNAIAKLPGLTVGNLNFNYTIGTNSSFTPMPSWAPSRIFDDGTHTYIQFPQNIAARDMPALFVMDDAGKTALVNYQVKYPYFVVDKIFRQAVLVIGVGSQQTRITITNRAYT